MGKDIVYIKKGIKALLKHNQIEGINYVEE
jgi:hypothetical protein